jgi:hypothetical protein
VAKCGNLYQNKNNIGLKIIAIFGRILAKIAKNTDHNADPCE